VGTAARLCAAACTGDVKVLQRASKTALNRSDDEEMTPAMWSAARGQLSALRVVVERGFVTSTFCLLRITCNPVNKTDARCSVDKLS